MQNSLFLLIFLFSFFRVAIAQLDLKDTTIKVGYSVPSIELTPNLKKAFIKLNAVRQNQLSNKLKNADTLFTIIHIGDSHVQGDFFSGSIRKHLQGEFGDAGQGMLFPYALAKSYGPRGTAIKTTGKWNGLKTLSQNLVEPLGLMGYGAFTRDSNATIVVTLNEKFEGPAFRDIRIWHTTDSASYSTQLNKSFELRSIKSYPSGWGVSLFSNPDSVRTFSISAVSTSSVQNHYGFFGYEFLPKRNRGVNYHHCGVVGAQFPHFINQAPLAIEQISHLHPDMIIFSFGTNEAYNYQLDTLEYRLAVESYIRKIQSALPNVAIILTTAPDSRSQNRIPPHQVNVNRQLGIIAKNCGISLFDLNEAMGGWGSLHAWQKHQLALSDKLHFSKSGYGLQGKLFTWSLLKAYNRVNVSDSLNLQLLQDSVQTYMKVLIPKAKTDSLSKAQSDLADSTQGENETVVGKSTYKVHIVKQGESLSQIGKKYKVSHKMIAKLNHIKLKKPLKPGQRILIPKKK